MSGLEPIAALSFACNILQIVGVGLETVRVARQVYQDGALDPALSDNATLLGKLSGQIRSLTAVKPGVKLKSQETQLLELAKKCQDAARDLQEEVNFLNGPPTKAKLIATLKIAGKTTWRKRRLDRLEQKLEDAERLLQTGLLSRIYERSLAMDASLSSLDNTLRVFTEDYLKRSNTAMEIVKKHISAESKMSESSVKSHVTQVVRQTEKSVKQYIATAHNSVIDEKHAERTLRMREKLLMSLKYDRMNERRNQVVSSHPDTCTWLLKDGSEVDNSQSTTRNPAFSSDTPPWDSFSDWLRSTETIYWISGKPGSGKTTMMKYLVNEPKTHEYLNQWKPDCIIISHYFWRPGTPMQQSIKGLFCSLLHQLFSGSTEVLEKVFLNHSNLKEKDSETDWSKEELWSILESTIRGYDRPIAIFLDGLDEVLPGDGVLKLLGFIDELRDQSKTGARIKLCLASRAEPILLQELGKYPKLRLEDLNSGDLREYAKEKIVVPDDYHEILASTDNELPHSVSTFHHHRFSSPDELKGWLVDSLVQKAEGVFLWLYLTVTTVTKGLREGEAPKDLCLRIDNLPGDLSNLYADMWERMNEDGPHLKARAASYLQLAVAGIGKFIGFDLNLFIMMVATTPKIADRLLTPQSSELDSAESLIIACERTLKDSIARCTGLLICQRPKDLQPVIGVWHSPRYGEDYEKLIPYVTHLSQYSWLHRTARDFLLETEAGKRILSCSRFNDDQARVKLQESYLAIHRLFRTSVWAQDTTGELKLNGYTCSIDDLLWRTWPSLQHDMDAAVKIEISRLLRLYEEFYYHGILCSQLSVPPAGMQFRQEYSKSILQRTGMRFSYEITVRRQHEFLVEAAHFSEFNNDLLINLLPLIIERNLDANILSEIFVYACKFHATMYAPVEVMEAYVRSIGSLLDLGASPAVKQLHRITLPGFLWSPFVLVSGSPVQVLTNSLLKSTLSLCFTNHGSYKNYFLKLFELVSRLVTLGASLTEEVYVKITLEDNSILFGDLWRLLYRHATGVDRSEEPLFLILAYPVSALLSILHSVLNPAIRPHVKNLEGLKEVSSNGYGKGSLVAVVKCGALGDGDEVIPCLTPTLFRAKRILNVAPDHDLGGELQHLVRLIEDSMHQAVQQRDFCLSGHSTAIRCTVAIPQRSRENLVEAVNNVKLDSDKVKERRRILRTRLGIQTPLEEPEWQNDPLVRWAS